MKLYDQIRFKLTGKKIPVYRVSEMNWIGKIGTLQDVGSCKDRPNSVVDLYTEKGWEKDKETTPITFIDRWGIPSQAWVVSEDGCTVNLYTKPVDFPKREEIIGHAATMDDMADSMDLGKSVRNYLIGALFGAAAWAFLGPIFGAILS